MHEAVSSVAVQADPDPVCAGANEMQPAAGVSAGGAVGTSGEGLTGGADVVRVLHVGCGAYGRGKLPPVFRHADWREIRLDIDPNVSPDFVASITDMRAIPDAAVDAVYSSHNIEHLYPHEVPVALREMRRVLKPTGFAFIQLPDLQSVAAHIVEGRLDDPLYVSSMGAIAPLDILYGHRSSLAEGNLFMAHRTGFTGKTLGSALIKAGFAAAIVQCVPSAFALTALGFLTKPTEEQMARAQAQMLPVPDQPAVLYAAVD
jgi:SAM-dependent methyltransferase